MKTQNNNFLQHWIALMALLVLIGGQQSAAQTYLNLNYSDGGNKYSAITEVASITFDGSNGFVVRKTDNSVSTESLTLLKSITLDATNGGGTPLPVQLASLSVSMTKLNAELRWTTATEENNFGFEIERAMINGQLKIDYWKKIGFVGGNGTSNTPKQYSYIDGDLHSGKYSYRLKQIDRDGKFTYSQTVEATVRSVPNVFALEQNYPNPFNPSTMIGFTLQVSGPVSLKVYDAIGREAATLVNENLESGVYYQRTFDASHLSSGIYYVRLMSGERIQMRKLMLIK